MKRVLGVLLLIVGVCLVLAPSQPVNADGVTISAFISPVRYVLVDTSDKIVEIETNTTAKVSPVVELASNPNEVIPINRSIDSQYLYIMANCLGDRKYGVVYSGQCQNMVASKVSIWSFAQILSVVYKVI